jgi:hypothetical protein
MPFNQLSYESDEKGISADMAVTLPPELEEAGSLPTETKPQRRAGGWSLRRQPRVGLNLGSDDELLMLENRTEVPWVVYHNYHQLGIIDPAELLVFHLCKHGSLQVRPCAKDDTVEYLILSLNYYVNQVYIYRRRMSKELEVYDMRAA